MVSFWEEREIVWRPPENSCFIASHIGKDRNSLGSWMLWVLGGTSQPGCSDERQDILADLFCQVQLWRPSSSWVSFSGSWLHCRPRFFKSSLNSEGRGRLMFPHRPLCVGPSLLSYLRQGFLFAGFMLQAS